MSSVVCDLMLLNWMMESNLLCILLQVTVLITKRGAGGTTCVLTRTWTGFGTEEAITAAATRMECTGLNSTEARTLSGGSPWWLNPFNPFKYWWSKATYWRLSCTDGQTLQEQKTPDKSLRKTAVNRFGFILLDLMTASVWSIVFNWTFSIITQIW